MIVLNKDELIREVEMELEQEEKENGTVTEYYFKRQEDLLNVIDNIEDILKTNEHGYLALKNSYGDMALTFFDYDLIIELEEDYEVEDYNAGDIIYNSIYKINDYKRRIY